MNLMVQRNILIVEDNDDIREVMTFVSEGLGFTVKKAANGEEGLKIISEGFLPKLILLDLTLPDMTGIEVLNKIRTDEQTYCSKVIIVSEWDDLPDKIREAGADGFLYKPFNLEQLEEIIYKLGH